MKRICLSNLALAVIALAGCTSKTAKNTAPENEKVSLFKEGKGVLFSDDTRKLFRLEVAEVTGKPMQRRVQKTAQVYRIGRDGTPTKAVVLLDANEATALTVGQLVSL